MLFEVKGESFMELAKVERQEVFENVAGEIRHRGKFITFEGVEGAGKTTQLELLVETLNKAGYEVLQTREPGEGAIGTQIRKIILDPDNTALTSVAETMLYGADRAQHVETVLQPALDDGKVIVCDRYVDSHMAYQGYGRGIDKGLLAGINQMATGGLMPDLTIMLLVPPEIGLARVAVRGAGENVAIDRIEKEKMDFHQKVYNGYKEIAENDSQRVKLLDGTKTIKQLQKEIQNHVAELLVR